MASIQGITIKGIKTFMGDEGIFRQGNIYLGSKKIAFWSEDPWGGPDEFQMRPEFSEEKFCNLIKTTNIDKTKYYKNPSGKDIVIEYDIEMFFSDLLVLMEREKQYKKRLKKGYSIMLEVTDMYHCCIASLNDQYAPLSDIQIKEKMSSYIESAKKHFYKNVETQITIIRNMDFFTVGEPIKLEDIMD